jgi:hypothetical protein
MSTLLKSNNKLLKHSNPWAYFDGATSYLRYADNDAFSFTDGTNDLPFGIEFDLYPLDVDSLKMLIYKGISSGNFEYSLRITSGTLLIRLWSNGNSAIYIGASVPIISKPYKVKITYDGSKLWSGIKISLDNVDTTTTNSSAGSYAGMINATSGVYIGTNNGSSFILHGYLRNLIISKNSIYVFNIPLQDSDAVSQDVIGGVSGTVVNVSVVNKLETERWAYFDGVSSNLSIGTTSTLGWMNSGTFNVQFDLKLLKAPTASAVHIYTSSAAVHYGFFFQFITNGQIRLYWCNGTGVYAIGMSAMDVCVLGTNYHYLLQGNGTQIRLYVVNSDTGANFYDSGWVSCNYVPNATMYFPLVVGRNAYNAQFQLKNFTIYSDTNGTQPFFSLPFQNPDAIAVDTIGGLVGTNNNVILINNMANILKS